MDSKNFPIMKCITDCRSTLTDLKTVCIIPLSPPCCHVQVRWDMFKPHVLGENNPLTRHKKLNNHVRIQSECSIQCFPHFLINFLSFVWKFKQFCIPIVLTVSCATCDSLMWSGRTRRQQKSKPFPSPILNEWDNFCVLCCLQGKTPYCSIMSQSPGCFLTHLYSLLPSSQDGTEQDVGYCWELRVWRGENGLHSTYTLNGQSCNEREKTAEVIKA